MIDADTADDDVPGWFWDVIDLTRPSVAALETWLATQPGETIARFAFAYWTASTDLADYADGIDVDGFAWSEDDMEDLCEWVVSQGRTYWQSVMSGEHSLRDAAAIYADRSTHWSTEVVNPEHRGYQAPGSIAHGVYWVRFGTDLDDRLDEPDFQL